MKSVHKVASVALSTEFGRFRLRAYLGESGCVYLALCFGEVRNSSRVLARVHSECLTGDVLSSLRCDCGNQLRTAMNSIAKEGKGVLLYAIGHEGRGIGLLNKLRAYELQDAGHDTVDGNLKLGLPVDARDYGEAAEVFQALGVRSVRLITNNPEKISALGRHGVKIDERVSAHIAPSWRQLPYLKTKQSRMQHMVPQEAVFNDALPAIDDVTRIIGTPNPREERPYVVLKYAQTLDGRIASGSGDSKWISGESERRISHALRASSDAVLVGAGTVIADDPLLTVRMLPGPNPARVVLDSTLRLSPESKIFDDQARTIVITAYGNHPEKVERLSKRARVITVPDGPSGVDLTAALREMRNLGIGVLMVEGGGRVITSFLRAGLADRVICSIAPGLMGSGTDAVGDLGTTCVSEQIRLANRIVTRADDDILVAGDVVLSNDRNLSNGQVRLADSERRVV